MECVGLVTDFGDSPYAGIMRAVVKSIAGPGACVVDIDHSIPSFSSIAGAYVVYHTYRWLPRGSIITVVVDPGVGSAREAIAVEAGDYIFIGPNNGVLYPAVSREGFRRAVSLSPQRVAGMAVERFRGKLPGGRWRISYTFHGRDLFAPAAALALSGVDIEELGEPMELGDLARTSIDYVERNNGGYKAVVVYVDKFGNVALSVREYSIPLRLGDALIIETRAASFRAPLQRTFSDVSPGDLVAYINSFGHLELAVNQGSASKRLGVDVGERIKILVPEEAGSTSTSQL